jgi:hypothetical protein
MAVGLPEGDGATDPLAEAEAVAEADGDVVAVTVALGALVGVPVGAVVDVAVGAVVGDGVEAAGVHAISARLAMAVKVSTRHSDI